MHPTAPLRHESPSSSQLGLDPAVPSAQLFRALEDLYATTLEGAAPTDRRGLQQGPCRFVSGEWCIACGPDVEALLDRVRVVSLDGVRIA